jgi:hypothetical protein
MVKKKKKKSLATVLLSTATKLILSESELNIHFLFAGSPRPGVVLI